MIRDQWQVRVDSRLRALEVALLSEPFITFIAGDTTPSVGGGRRFLTANAGATIISALDDGKPGQEVVIKIGDANTTIDFSGTTLKGNAGADWSPVSGDFMYCTFDGTNWLCAVTEA